MGRFLRHCFHCGQALRGRFKRAVHSLHACCEPKAKRTVKTLTTARETDHGMVVIMMMTINTMLMQMIQPAPARKDVDASADFTLTA